MQATVTHNATGRTWTVRAFTSKPNNRQRVGLRIAQSGQAGPVIPCAVCAEPTADTGTNAPTVETPYGPLTVPTGQADRIVNDHPAFMVDRPVAYDKATVANVCHRHNARSKATAYDAQTLARMEAIAVDLLDRHA